MNAVVSVVSVSAVCAQVDQGDQVVPAHQVDDIDENYEFDPVHKVDHKDEHRGRRPTKNATFFAKQKFKETWKNCLRPLFLAGFG